MSGLRISFALAVLWLATACASDTIDHTETFGGFESADGGGSCGGTGGLCGVSCADDSDCTIYSDHTVCGDNGECQAQTGCLTVDVCGDEARCHWDECSPLGDKPLGATCWHAAECRDGGCAGVCQQPCAFNRDCADAERCVAVYDVGDNRHGFCQVSSPCEACTRPTDVCDPLGVGALCLPRCRTNGDCATGDCLAEDYGDLWSCGSQPAGCPADTFRFGNACFLHQACVADQDCPSDMTCRSVSTLLGGYCSPGDAS